jgi:hypothetical protein
MRAAARLCAAVLLVASGLRATAAPPPGTAAAPAASTAAEWMSRTIIISLSDLPRAYTCNDLWYRFRDLMYAIGAQQLKILTYDCADKAPSLPGAPKVELRFQFPTALTGDNVRYADFHAIPREVRLVPGDPHAFTADDCELMRQITAELFGALELPVTAAKFACSAAGGAAPGFAVTVRALLAPQDKPHQP